MRITHLGVVNHRFVPDLILDVRHHLVLVGPNETGKTSLLRCLDAVLAGGRQHLYSTFTTASFRDEDTPLIVSVTFGEFTDQDRAVFADEINVSPSGEPSVEAMNISVTAVVVDGEVEIERAFEKPGIDRRVRHDHLEAIGWSFLPAGRSPERELGVGRTSALRTLMGSIDLADDEEQVVKLLVELNGKLDSSAAVAQLRAQLAEDLSLLYPRPVSADGLVARITSAATDDPRAHADLHLRQDGEDSRPLHQQSDGLRSLTTIVVQRLARPATILAIDEPEVHLHPRSQARLAGMLSSGSGQCLVATHSAHVLTAFSPDNAVALVAGGVRQLPIDESRDRRRFHAQWWSDHALEPLTANGAVVVEGPSDRLILRRAAALLGADLDHLGITVVVANGATSFKPIYKLLGADGFNINLFGLIDEAEVALIADNLGVASDAASLLAVQVHASKPDLEGECVRGLGVPRHLEMLTTKGDYKEATVLGRFKVTTPADIDPDEYSEWCRSSKVEVAMALAAAMTPADAARIASITGLVTAIKSS